MKQLYIQGPNEVALVDIPEPEAGPRDAVVRISACGICGSDLGYVKLGGLAGPSDQPMALGHEFSGVVESVGSELSGIEPGTRVVVNPISAGNNIGNGGPEGAFAPRMLLRNADQPGCLIPIPDSLTMEEAALAEPLSVGLSMVNRVAAKADDKAVVFGAGPIGLAAVASLAWRGARDIIAVDLSPERLAIAQKLGASHALHPDRDDVWKEIRALHGTAEVLGMPAAGSDVYIEASGHSPLIPEVMDNAKSDARLGIVALHRTPMPVNFLLVMIKSLHIVGSMAYPDDWSEAIEILVQRDLSPMITHRFALDDFSDALAVAQDPQTSAKVMIVNEPG
jgi:threonine dehydrogenase-like Zn-dependent dehydrogenase